MRTPILLALLFFVLLAPQVVSAQTQSPQDVLKQVDRVATLAADFTAKIELTTVDADSTQTVRKLNVWQKGANKRLIKVTAPARLKGVGLLATDKDQLYMYLPSFGRARRIAGQKRGQAFLGSNFTQDDMVRTSYSERFQAAQVSEDKQTWTLRLTPITPDDEPFHHLVLTVRKADFVVAQVDFFKTERETTQKLVATDIKVIGKTPLAHKVESFDLATGSRSTAILSDVKTDTGIKDAFFSKRTLKRKR